MRLRAQPGVRRAGLRQPELLVLRPRRHHHRGPYDDRPRRHAHHCWPPSRAKRKIQRNHDSPNHHRVQRLDRRERHDHTRRPRRLRISRGRRCCRCERRATELHREQQWLREASRSQPSRQSLGRSENQDRGRSSTPRKPKCTCASSSVSASVAGNSRLPSYSPSSRRASSSAVRPRLPISSRSRFGMNSGTTPKPNTRAAKALADRLTRAGEQAPRRCRSHRPRRRQVQPTDLFRVGRQPAAHGLCGLRRLLRHAKPESRSLSASWCICTYIPGCAYPSTAGSSTFAVLMVVPTERSQRQRRTSPFVAWPARGTLFLWRRGATSARPGACSRRASTGLGGAAATGANRRGRGRDWAPPRSGAMRGKAWRRRGDPR